MRLFIVEHISLKELALRSDGPVNGDTVVFIRKFQSPHSETPERFQSHGINIIWSDDLFSREEAIAIDAFHDKFIQNWYRPNGQDISLYKDISIAYVLGFQLSLNYLTGHIVRFGEVCRKALEICPYATEIITDVIDGKLSCVDHGKQRIRTQRLSVLKHFADSNGVALKTIKPKVPIPSYRYKVSHDSPVNLILRLIGGFRPKYLLPRVKSTYSTQANKNKRIYMFLNHGIRHTARCLGEKPGVQLYLDQSGFKNSIPLRYDHLLGLPGFQLISAALKFWRYCNEGFPSSIRDAYCTYNGIDYGSFLSLAAQAMMRRQLFSTVVRIRQSEKLMEICEPNALLVNGESSAHVRTLIEMNKGRDSKTIFFRHGYVTYNAKFYPMGHNNPEVIYVANGLDHRQEYGTHLPEGQKPRIEVIPNPATSEVRGLKRRSSDDGVTRVLMMNFTSSWGQSTIRANRYDDFVLGLVKTAKVLHGESFDFSYRPHQGDNIEHLNFAKTCHNAEHAINLDQSASFTEALRRHDVIVLNVTSCHYQALSAGWPTIFFEPYYNASDFIGLPGATDIKFPLAKSSDELVSLLLECQKPDNWIATFPNDFNGPLAERFVGKNAVNADQLLADFIANEVGFS